MPQACQGLIRVKKRTDRAEIRRKNPPIFGKIFSLFLRTNVLLYRHCLRRLRKERNDHGGTKHGIPANEAERGSDNERTRHGTEAPDGGDPGEEKRGKQRKMQAGTLRTGAGADGVGRAERPGLGSDERPYPHLSARPPAPRGGSSLPCRRICGGSTSSSCRTNTAPRASRPGS